MVDINPDKATDWVAVLISSVVALSTWGVLLHKYITTGELSGPMLAAGGLFVLLATLTLFGVEKVTKAIELKK